MQTTAQEKTDIKIVKLSSPICPRRAWQLESFLLKNFEYGDYNFRRALSGTLSSRLRCTFFTARNNGSILAAAGSLYYSDNPAVAILGPVCTDPAHRKKGLALQVSGMLLEHLKAQKIQAVYLGVKDNIPAVNLYKKLGFTQHSGIVMRKLFVSNDEFNKRYRFDQETIIRRMTWYDYPEVSALLCEPADMYTSDFHRSIFSVKYIESRKFLPVFPQMMNSFEKNESFVNVLQVKEDLRVVGMAEINIPASVVYSHIAILEFFVLDGFIDRTQSLIKDTINKANLCPDRMVISYCLDCDTAKKQILKSLGAKQYSVLPDHVNINGQLEAIVIYKL